MGTGYESSLFYMGVRFLRLLLGMDSDLGKAGRRAIHRIAGVFYRVNFCFI